MSSALRRSVLVVSLAAVVAGVVWFRHARRSAASTPASTLEIRLANGQTLTIPLSHAHPDAVKRATRTSDAAASPFHATDPRLRLAADVGVSLPERSAAVDHLLADPLSATTLAETITFLRSPVPADGGALERERALRNHLLNGLRAQPGAAPSLVPALSEQAADETQDPGLRDYALQHLAAWTPDLDQAGRNQAESALFAALKDRGETYAGTALVGLNDLARRGALSVLFDAGAEARRLVLDEQMSVLSRLTALALASELGLTGPDLTTVARLWSDPASPVPEGARRTAQAFLKNRVSAN